MKKLGSVRQSQLITTYGVGAILPLGNESYMVAGLDSWKAEETVSEPRLCKLLGVSELRLPPGGDVSGLVGLVGFPRMVFCTSCRRLGKRVDLADGDQFLCHECGAELSPSRFVLTCDRGHIDDFPYDRWVHAERGRQGDTHRLSLNATGESLSLSGVMVKCSCGARRSMEGAFNRANLSVMCTGATPWLQTRSSVECTQPMRVQQRGAAAVWAAVERSAVTIPPWSSRLVEYLERERQMVSAIPPATLPERLSKRFPGTPTEEIHAAVRALLNEWDQESAQRTSSLDSTQLMAQEYQALMRGQTESTGSTFVASLEEVTPVMEAAGLDTLVKVSRLRVVSALAGFTRGSGPKTTEDFDFKSLLARGTPEFLPAMEILGEGVFLNLGEESLANFLSNPSVAGRLRRIPRGEDPKSDRFIVIHTLAHALMAEMASYAGYPLTSLRERIYADDGQAGILVFTSSGDAAGSLGGLAALSDSAPMEAILRGIAAHQSWCTNDPLCIETVQGGVGGHNLAACHACMLVPEVSCEARNEWLDRGLLIGGLGDSSPGLLSDLAS